MKKQKQRVITKPIKKNYKKKTRKCHRNLSEDEKIKKKKKLC